MFCGVFIGVYGSTKISEVDPGRDRNQNMDPFEDYSFLPSGFQVPC